MIASADGLHHRQSPLEQRKERRGLALDEKPFVLLESHVGRSGGERSTLGGWQRCEKRNSGE